MNENLTAAERDAVQAVENGNHTATEVADATEHSKGHVQKLLKRAHEKGALDRYRDGPGYTYEVADGDAEDDGTEDGDDGVASIMPANRNYNWDDPDYQPSPGEYYSTDGELERGIAQMEHRHETNTPVRMLVAGPMGVGKTTFAQTLAAYLGTQEQVSYHSIQFSKDMNDGDLVGVPNYAGDKTVWVDGELSKAFLAASEDGPGDARTVVLHLDELNRAPPHVHNALFEALDHRGAVRLDGPRGGELIQANPLDIIVVATINEGAEYVGTNRMDLATKGRFTTKFHVDYLARYEDPQARNETTGVDDEASMLVNEHGVPPNVARAMVEAIVDVRADAADDSNMSVQRGTPTRFVKAWAGTARSYALAEVENPIMKAAEDVIVGNLYDDPQAGDDDTQKQSVRSTLESHLDGAPVDEDEFAAWNADETVECRACGWSAAKPDAEDMGVLATMTCPSCGDDEQVDTRTK